MEKGMELMQTSNQQKWIKQSLSEPMLTSDLQERVNDTIGSLNDKRDEPNKRKMRGSKIEAMRDSKKVERVKPIFFRKMQTRCTKE